VTMNENSDRMRGELDTVYRQLEQTASRLILVNQAGELTARSHDVAEIARELLASILDSVFAERGLTLLYSPDGTTFEVISSQGVSAEELEAFKGSEAESTALWIASLREAPVTRTAVEEAEEWEGGLPHPTFAVYVPLIIMEELIGAIAVGDKTTGEAYDPAELSFLANLGHHAAVALSHARLHTQLEKRLRDLDTLLKISHEITSTLDLDRILKTVVTMASALAALRVCAIGIQRRGSLGLDATGGEKPDRQERETLERLLQFVALAGTEVSATRRDLPEGESGSLLKQYFEETGAHSFWGIPLKDEQGVLGAYCQTQMAGLPATEELELLRIMANQATVAIRNAELYNQVPFIGFLEPLLEKRRRLWAAGRKRIRSITLGIAVLLVLLLVIPAPYRTSGVAAVFPGQRLELRSPISGVVEEVYAAEGSVVGPDSPVGRVRSLDLELEYRDVQSALERARREEAAANARGDQSAAHLAGINRAALAEQATLLERQLAAARIASPFPAVVLTPHLEERRGDYLASGDVFCEVGTLNDLRVEIALPEKDWYAVKLGQRVRMKFYAYAERTFEGRVDILAPAALNTQQGERVLIVTARIAAPEGVRPGMTGVARVYLGSHSLLWHIWRPFSRFFGLRWWG
jgi:GAF domain-containing protein